MKNFNVCIFILVFSIKFLSIPHLYSQWTSVGLPQGNIDIVAMSKDSSGFIFAGTSTLQIYRSSDNGVTWQIFTNDFPPNYINSIISTSLNTIVGTRDSGIYITTNHGLNWIQSNNGLSTTSINCLEKSGPFIFAGCFSGIYRCKDNGKVWVPCESGFGNYSLVWALTKLNNYLFASSSMGSEGMVFVSSNFGNNWVQANSGLPANRCSALGTCGNNIYATSNNLYMTSDYGQKWSLVPGLSGAFEFYSQGNTIITCKYFANYLSTNGGTNWSTITLPSNYIVESCLIENDTIIAGTRGLDRSSNSGMNWIRSDSGIYISDFLSVIAVGDYVLTGTNGFGCFRSTTSGLVWNYMNAFNDYIYSLSFVSFGQNVYAIPGGELYSSTDYGYGWVNIRNDVPAGNPFTCIAQNDSLIIAGVNNKGLYRSINNGTNWSLIQIGLQQSVFPIINSIILKDNIAIACIDTSNLGNSQFLYKSTDYGLNWVRLTNTGINTDVNEFIEHKGIFYAGLNYNNGTYGVYKSTNEGNNWFSVSNGLPNLISVNSLVFVQDTLYAASNTAGVYKSTDFGSSWTSYNDGLINTQINSLSVGNNKLFAAGVSYLWQRDIITSVCKFENAIPNLFNLSQNYPNPFNPSTKIKFEIPPSPAGEGRGEVVKLIIYDILGREVAVLVNEKLQPGSYEVEWNGTNYPSGVYFYKLTVSDSETSSGFVFSQTKKLILLK